PATAAAGRNPPAVGTDRWATRSDRTLEGPRGSPGTAERTTASDRPTAVRPPASSAATGRAGRPPRPRTRPCRPRRRGTAPEPPEPLPLADQDLAGLHHQRRLQQDLDLVKRVPVVQDQVGRLALL